MRELQTLDPLPEMVTGEPGQGLEQVASIPEGMTPKEALARFKADPRGALVWRANHAPPGWKPGEDLDEWTAIIQDEAGLANREAEEAERRVLQ